MADVPLIKVARIELAPLGENLTEADLHDAVTQHFAKIQELSAQFDEVHMVAHKHVLAVKHGHDER